jgi:hypothetical protein
LPSHFVDYFWKCRDTFEFTRTAAVGGTHPFCLHEMPLLIRARRSSISTCPAFVLDVVETLHRPYKQTRLRV